MFTLRVVGCRPETGAGSGQMARRNRRWYRWVGAGCNSPPELYLSFKVLSGNGAMISIKYNTNRGRHPFRLSSRKAGRIISEQFRLISNKTLQISQWKLVISDYLILIPR